jgi:hypothetical protein
VSRANFEKVKEAWKQIKQTLQFPALPATHADYLIEAVERRNLDLATYKRGYDARGDRIKDLEKRFAHFFEPSVNRKSSACHTCGLIAEDKIHIERPPVHSPLEKMIMGEKLTKKEKEDWDAATVELESLIKKGEPK